GANYGWREASRLGGAFPYGSGKSPSGKSRRRESRQPKRQRRRDLGHNSAQRLRSGATPSGLWSRAVHPPDLPAFDGLYAALPDVAPAISDLSPETRASLLRNEVYAAVDRLKRMGLMSAQVESAMLSFVADAWPGPVCPDAIADIRAWCLQRYYGSTPSDPGSLRANSDGDRGSA